MFNISGYIYIFMHVIDVWMKFTSGSNFCYCQIYVYMTEQLQVCECSGT